MNGFDTWGPPKTPLECSLLYCRWGKLLSKMWKLQRSRWEVFTLS